MSTISCSLLKNTRQVMTSHYCRPCMSIKNFQESRLFRLCHEFNRICPGKEDTFVLDFVNDEDDIVEAFQDYFQKTSLESTTDPNHLYDLKNIIEKSQIVWQSEIDNFARVFFQPNFNPKNQKALYSFIDPAIERFLVLPIDKTGGELTQGDVQKLRWYRLHGYTRI